MDKNENNQNCEKASVQKYAEHRASVSMDQKDVITSIVLIIFSLYLLGTGTHMSMTTIVLADSAWYGTPGMFPIFIGAGLLIFSSVMLGSLLRQGVCIGSEILQAAKNYFLSKSFRKFVVAIGFLAIYIFGLFGRIHYNIATFLYLFATMMYFRKGGFSVWKVAVICVVFTAALYLFFGVLAGVPLP